jgi:hypothetical protein
LHHKIEKNMKIASASTLFLSLLPLCGIAAEPFVITQIGPSSVLWSSQQPMDKESGLQLTVSGPENWYFQRQFTQSAEATFTPYDNPAGIAPDGTYTFEVKAIKTVAKQRLPSDNYIQSRADDLRPSVVSGAFQIINGTIVSNPNLVETPPNKDQVIADDHIVVGSQCVGIDCINGESFGFDTLRLKENNIRIHFDDTSASASFPNHDWRIIINDSSNGGLNKFALQDATAGTIPLTIEGDAKTNSIYVDSSGRVGFKTSSPATDLHAVNGNTPTLRLEQDGSSGFTAQTWDIAGNETGFFIRDVTNSSNLPFRILSGAPSSSLVIDANGRIGIGAGTTPTAQLHIKAPAGQPKFRIE